MSQLAIADLDSLLSAVLAAMDAGKAIPPGREITKYPDLARELDSFLANHAWFECLTLPMRSLATVHAAVQAGAPAPSPLVPDPSPAPHHSSFKLAPEVAVPPAYELLDFIGGGGMGVVYKARHRTLGRIDALKFIKSGSWAEPAERERFLREARTLAMVDHANVVRVYDAGTHAGFDYCALEFVAGGSLARRIEKESLSPADAARLIAMLARGLHAVHEQGLIHRDIKPDNILLARSDPIHGVQKGVRPAEAGHYEPKLADFGLARPLIGAQLTLAGQLVGTPMYMSPEQFEGAAIGPATDIWSLGVVLYRLLTGELPFNGNSVRSLLEQVRASQPRQPRLIKPEIPESLEAICLRCLEKDPAQRFPTALALAEALEAAPSGASSTASVASGAASARREQQTPLEQIAQPSGQFSPVQFRRGPWLAGAVLATLVALSLAAWAVHSFWHRPAIEADADSSTASSSSSVTPTALRISSFNIQHLALNAQGSKIDSAGALGKDVYQARLNDRVTLAAKLTHEAYAYILAFRADSSVECCFPEDDNEPPPLTDNPSYPYKDRGVQYGLMEGAGLWVFVVVVSDDPLPSFNDWKKSHSLPSWTKQDTPQNTVWFDDGHWVEAVTPKGLQRGDRGKGAEVPGQTAVVRVTDSLKKETGAAAISTIGFAVLPHEK